MTIQEIMKRIELPEKAQEIVWKYRISEEEFLFWKVLFEKDFQTFMSKWKESPQRLKWILWFYLKMSCEVYDKYQEQKIDEQIFDDTFYDITIWCKECYRKYGIYGLEEVFWLSKSIKMELFRLGRLQFEPIVLSDGDLEIYHLAKNKKILNVHIPAGDKLDHLACKESLKKARTFFRDPQIIFICESWLLSPELNEILPKTSNIIQFQKMYQIMDVYYDYPQAEERVFGEVKSDKIEYPEKTSLQSRLKKYLLNGNKVGIGRGIILP